MLAGCPFAKRTAGNTRMKDSNAHRLSSILAGNSCLTYRNDTENIPIVKRKYRKLV
jgi:hypothetical protein